MGEEAEVAEAMVDTLTLSLHVFVLFSPCVESFGWLGTGRGHGACVCLIGLMGRSPEISGDHPSASFSPDLSGDHLPPPQPQLPVSLPNNNLRAEDPSI